MKSSLLAPIALSALLNLTVIAHAQTTSSVPAADPEVAEIKANFERDVQPIIARSCQGCHDSQAKAPSHVPLLRNYQAFYIREASKKLDFNQTFPNWAGTSNNPDFILDAIESRLTSRTLSLKKMPPADAWVMHDSLNSSDRKIILDWIKDSKAILASSTQAPQTASELFQNRCMECHTQEEAPGGLALQVTGDSVTFSTGNDETGIPYFTPSDPMHSAVYLVLSSDHHERSGLPHMPKIGNALNDQEQKTIYEWIKAQRGPASTDQITDPPTNDELNELKSRDDHTVLNLSNNGDTFTLDAISLVIGNASLIYSKTLDYDHYPALNVPGLLDVKTVQTPSDGQKTVWFHTSIHFIFNFDAEYFTAVQYQQLSMENYLVSWRLASKPDQDSHPDNGKVKAIDGAWYLRQIDPQETFIRYHLSLAPNGFGAGLAAGAIKSSMRDDYFKLLQGLNPGNTP